MIGMGMGDEGAILAPVWIEPELMRREIHSIAIMNVDHFLSNLPHCPAGLN